MSKKENDKHLFAEFEQTSKEAWIEKASADLKGADFEKRLVWKNLNEIAVQPFYSIEDRKEPLANTGKIPDVLINYRRIQRDSKDKNALAIKAVSEGMNGIVFEIGSKDRPDVLLKDIDLEHCAVSFSLTEEHYAFSSELLEYLREKGVSKGQLKGYLEIPFFGDYLNRGVRKQVTLDVLAEATQLFSNYSDFRTLVVSGREYLDSGANQSQEIAFTLNSIVFLAEEMKCKGLKEELIFKNLLPILGIGSEYFPEIAKFRAFNSLLNLIAGKYGVRQLDCMLLSRSSRWSKSVLDANTNMLRATTETMSALLGNSQAIEIDPYDQETGNTKEFSRRIAGNIATILKEESYFGKVRNPVDGSYYVEELTSQLASKALELFKEIENAGGFAKGIDLQMIQNKIAVVRMTKNKLMSRRRRTQVGVNKYPNLTEKVSRDLLCQEIPFRDPRLLQPGRAGLELEAVRAKTEAIADEHGVRPRVELASFGDVSMRKARAGFAFDFLGVGGFQMREEQSYSSARVAAEKSAGSDSHIVVICSSDADYAESAMEFVKVFRTLAPDKVLLLAGAPADLVEKLTAAGLNASIHMGSDVVDTLNLIHKILLKNPKLLKP